MPSCARALKEAAAPANAALDEAVDALADPALDSFARLRGQILRTAEYPQIERDGRHWDTGRDRQALARHPDRACARMEGYWQGLQSRREPMASVLLGLVQVNDATAPAGRGLGAGAGLSSMGLDAATVDATLRAIEQHAGDRRAYQDMLLRHAARSGIDAPQIWDTTVPDAGYCAAGADAGAAARQRRRCHAAPRAGVRRRTACAARSGQPPHGPGHRTW
jgi:oligoendopeptidase F